jgi:hypothetical protein
MIRKLYIAIIMFVGLCLALMSVQAQTGSSKNSNTNDGQTVITQKSYSGGEDCPPNKSSNKNSNRNSNSNYDSPAELALERFKKLEGVWTGRNSSGQEKSVSFRRIAKGAFSIENAFAGGGLTMFYLDGNREMLTNCCSADNRLQPVSTALSEDAVTLTFSDEGNLQTKNLVFRFIDNDTLILQKTEQQMGGVNLVEKIELKRAN